MKKEIWIYLETDCGGNLTSSSKELLSQALVIAGRGAEYEQYRIRALAVGSEGNALTVTAREAVELGADAVTVFESRAFSVLYNEYIADAIAKEAGKEKPELILFERTADQIDLAPRIAGLMQTGMISDCVDVTVDPDGFKWIRHAFGGTSSAAVSFREAALPHIVSIRPGSFRSSGVKKTESAASIYSSGEKESGTLHTGDNSIHERVKIIEYTPEKEIARPSLLEILEAASDRGQDIGTADVIVAGGSGAGPDGFALISELADLLHGAVGASRVAVDKGWISHAHLIGQSGRTVAPSLYINCGISGSVQHIVGMRDAKYVVSINKDPRALIFNVSDYGIVGDLHKVLPLLIAEIRRHRA